MTGTCPTCGRLVDTPTGRVLPAHGTPACRASGLTLTDAARVQPGAVYTPGTPVGAPPEWPRMSWHAQQRWTHRRWAAARPADPEPAPPWVDPFPGRVWIDAEIRDGHRAVRAGHPTDAQKSAYLAGERLRHRGTQARSPHPTMPVPDAVQTALDMTGQPVSRVCEAVGRTPGTVAQILHRHGHDAAARRFWAEQGARRQTC